LKAKESEKLQAIEDFADTQKVSYRKVELLGIVLHVVLSKRTQKILLFHLVLALLFLMRTYSLTVIEFTHPTSLPPIAK
jgi:hypothetical protein